MLPLNKTDPNPYFTYLVDYYPDYKKLGLDLPG